MFTLRFDLRAPARGAPIEAEDMAVLDIISRGRVAYVLGLGHRQEEYDLFGVDRRRRGELADRRFAELLGLLGSDRITPGPTSGGPQLFVGGGSLAAARRAGRLGLGLIAQADTPGLRKTGGLAPEVAWPYLERAVEAVARAGAAA